MSDDWPTETIEKRAAWIAESYDGKPQNILDRLWSLLGFMARQYSYLEPLDADFTAALKRYESGEVRTLDEAFGVQDARKNVKMEGHRFKYENGLQIYITVKKLLKEGRVTPTVFTEVAEQYARGDGVIKQIYYEVKKIVEEPQTMTVTFHEPDIDP